MNRNIVNDREQIHNVRNNIKVTNNVCEINPCASLNKRIF